MSYRSAETVIQAILLEVANKPVVQFERKGILEAICPFKKQIDCKCHLTVIASKTRKLLQLNSKAVSSWYDVEGGRQTDAISQQQCNAKQNQEQQCQLHVLSD